MVKFIEDLKLERFSINKLCHLENFSYEWNKIEHFQAQDYVPKIWINIFVIKWQIQGGPSILIDMWLSSDQNISLKIFPWSQGKELHRQWDRISLTVQLNLLLFYLFIYLLLSVSLKRFITPWELQNQIRQLLKFLYPHAWWAWGKTPVWGSNCQAPRGVIC